ncbi:MAG: hypothetical protein LBT16_09550 [Treponema sp.]|jgi:hypothetical protein|nr:hypothetical protein [Treponema sp.]
MVKFPQKRLFLIVLTSCLVLAALGAEIFILTHLDHDCDGPECPVCLQIETAQNVLKGLKLAFIAAVFIAFDKCTNTATKQIHRCFAGLPTPIALGVKLNI